MIRTDAFQHSTGDDGRLVNFSLGTFLIREDCPVPIDGTFAGEPFSVFEVSNLIEIFSRLLRQVLVSSAFVPVLFKLNADFT
ncbi:hypothetical protein AB1L42_03995 [Thalassoglobus sp. JC818]|uniref:hypothetical protein n=1 Tax=Thalassoglobus sp. JC818 TaxID=3232136 RepID=UPI003459E127